MATKKGATKKGSGLLMVWADVPAKQEEEFNRWYNEEHVEDLLSIPGVLNAARYEAISGGPKYLACYELESPDVIESDAYQKQRANRSDWSKRMSPTVIATSFVRNVYGQLFPVEVSQATAESDMAPSLQIGRMDVPAEIEEEFNHWYNTVFVPGFESVPGCIRGRRYTAALGEPKYATVYEFEHETVNKSAEWATARDADPRSIQFRSQMTHAQGSPGTYRRIFPL